MTTLPHTPHAARKKSYAPHYTLGSLSAFQPDMHQFTSQLMDVRAAHLFIGTQSLMNGIDLPWIPRLLVFGLFDFVPSTDGGRDLGFVLWTPAWCSQQMDIHCTRPSLHGHRRFPQARYLGLSPATCDLVPMLHSTDITM